MVGVGRACLVRSSSINPSPSWAWSLPPSICQQFLNILHIFCAFFGTLFDCCVNGPIGALITGVLLLLLALPVNSVTAPPVQPAHHSSPCLQPPSSSSSYFLGARWTPITGLSITRGLIGSYALPLIGADLLRVLAFYGQGCTSPRTAAAIGLG